MNPADSKMNLMCLLNIITSYGIKVLGFGVTDNAVICCQRFKDL